MHDFFDGSGVKNPPAMRETWVQSQGLDDPLEKGKGKATHSSTLAWRIPFRYDLNQIPYDYTVEGTYRVKGLDLIECLKNYGQRFMTLYRRQ